MSRFFVVAFSFARKQCRRSFGLDRHSSPLVHRCAKEASGALAVHRSSCRFDTIVRVRDNFEAGATAWINPLAEIAGSGGLLAAWPCPLPLVAALPIVQSGVQDRMARQIGRHDDRRLPRILLRLTLRLRLALVGAGGGTSMELMKRSSSLLCNNRQRERSAYWKRCRGRTAETYLRGLPPSFLGMADGL
jgi:hypothetical protein